MMVDYDRFFMKTFVNKHSILKNLTASYWLKTHVFLFHVQAVVEAFSKKLSMSTTLFIFNFQICVINHIHFIIVITL